MAVRDHLDVCGVETEPDQVAPHELPLHIVHRTRAPIDDDDPPVPEVSRRELAGPFDP